MSGKKYEIKAKGQSHEPGQAIISNTQVKTKSVLSDV